MQYFQAFLVSLMLCLSAKAGLLLDEKHSSNDRYMMAISNFQIYPFVINMDSASDRLAAFNERYAASDLSTHLPPIKRFPAIPGNIVKDDEVDDLARQQIAASQRNGYRLKHHELTVGAIGCYISHFAVWESLLSISHGAPNSTVALVFEDDAVLAPDAYAQLQRIPFPDDTDIMLLSHWCLRCVPYGNEVPLRRVHKFFGLFGYLVTPKGAERIKKYEDAFPIRKQIDSMLSDMIEEGRLVVYQAEKSIVEMDMSFPTSIQIPLMKTPGIDEWSDDL